jgi:hypothetical protein
LFNPASDQDALAHTLSRSSPFGPLICPHNHQLGCTVRNSSAINLGNVLAADASGRQPGLAAVASEHGVYRVSLSEANGIAAENVLADAAVSVAVCGPQRFIVAGTTDKVWVLPESGHGRWEWVTDLVTSEGGVYDATAADLACDESDGTVFAATATALNMRSPSGEVSRLDYTQGMPVNDSASVAVEPHSGAVWIGTPHGLVRWARGKDADADWRFFWGQRYLPLGNSSVYDVAAVSSAGLGLAVVATDGGLAFLEAQTWTLAEKAAHYETILQQRHNRHGMVAECSMQRFGDVGHCVGGPSDNNGLWTSLVVVAEACRTALGGQGAAASLDTFFKGMKLLVDVTGIRGLMARSCVQPGTPAEAGDTWHNSTNPSLAGWQWKGDASSDEVVGHGFAYPAMARILGTAAGTLGAEALALLEDIVGYILENDYYLIDVTGTHTRWGVWNPEVINNK